MWQNIAMAKKPCRIFWGWSGSSNIPGGGFVWFFGVFFASDRNKPCIAILRHRNSPQLSSCSHENSWKLEVLLHGSPLCSAASLAGASEPEPVPSNWVTFTEFGTSQSLQKPKSTILSHFPLSPSGKLNFNEVLTYRRKETECEEAQAWNGFCWKRPQGVTLQVIPGQWKHFWAAKN